MITASQTVATIGAPLSMTTTVGTVTAGLGTVVAAVSGSVVTVHDIQLQLVNGTAATTCYIQSGTVQLRPVYMAQNGDGLLFVPPSGKELRMAVSQPLVLNNTAGSVAYTVRHTIESEVSA